MLKRIRFKGHGLSFTRTLCTDHIGSYCADRLFDGYEYQRTDEKPGAVCEVCDDYAQQTRAEINANTQ